MNRAGFLHLLVMGILLVTTSCRFYQLTAPQQLFDAAVQIENLDTVCTAEEGDIIVSAFEVSIYDFENQPIPNVPLEIYVAAGPGAVACAVSETSDKGRIQALYYCLSTFGDSVSVIHAIAGIDTVTATLHLHGTASPSEINLISDNHFIQIDPGQTTQSDIIACVSNSTGMPVAGIPVSFKITSGKGRIQSPVSTDENGVAKSSLFINGDWQGDLVISASVNYADNPEIDQPGWLNAAYPLIDFIAAGQKQTPEQVSAQDIIKIRFNTEP